MTMEKVHSVAVYKDGADDPMMQHDDLTHEEAQFLAAKTRRDLGAGWSVSIKYRRPPATSN